MNPVPAMKTSDPKAFGHVGLLVGGESAEREVSLNGGRAVFAALERKGVSVEMIDGGSALIKAIDDKSASTGSSTWCTGPAAKTAPYRAS